MYSFTSTNIQSLHQVDSNQPKLVIKCKCNRRFYQEQIYTCLLCSSYSCHYCTQIQFIQFQCRACKKVYDASNKNNRCQYCFSCTHCSNILSLAKDPQTKTYILMCQFCYWSTKEIKVSEAKIQDLLEKLNRLSSNIKDFELKIYNYAYTFFKQTNFSIQTQNQTSKYISNTRKPLLKNFMQESNQSNKQQIQKMEKNFDAVIKRVGLDQPSEQFHAQIKYPQGIPLLAKKVRKCSECRKPLTAIYRTRAQQNRTRASQQKVQLMHKDIRILQCQILPLQSQKAKIKLLKDAIINGCQCKANQVKQVQANKEFQVSIKVQNRMRNSTAQINYVFIVDGPIVK